MSSIPDLDLESFPSICGNAPGLTVALAEVFLQASAVCLDHNKHPVGTTLNVNAGKKPYAFSLRWPTAHQQWRDAHNDLQEATERGATCIAIQLARDLFQLQVAQRSRKGGGFDYWMSPVNEAPQLFQNTSRMEVSGILAAKDGVVDSRIKQKNKQISQSTGSRGFVAIVDFGAPRAHVEVV